MTQRLTIVIPLYNEAAIIDELVKRVEAARPAIEATGFSIAQLLLVNDGSTDRTSEIITEIATRISYVEGLELARNSGQTAALAAGIDHAQGDVVVTMDGDLQHDPADIPQFLTALNTGYDLVSGARHKRADQFFTRRIPSWCANFLMRKISGLALRDFGSTFKAYRLALVQRLELFGDLHRFMPVLAAREGARITEIDIPYHARFKGVSNYGLQRIFGVFEDLIFLLFFVRYLTRPIRAFGVLFLTFFGAGFFIAMVLMALWLIGVIPAVRDHGAMLLLSVFLMIIGIQFLAVGILAELLARIYHHTRDAKIYVVRRTLRAPVGR
jgi:glycosyltransferase involved in cell wall biosynthesis